MCIRDRDYEAHNEELYHHGRAPNNCGIYFAQGVDNPQQRITLIQPLLIGGSTEHRHHHPEQHTDDEGQDSAHNRPPKALHLSLIHI